MHGARKEPRKANNTFALLHDLPATGQPPFRQTAAAVSCRPGPTLTLRQLTTVWWVNTQLPCLPYTLCPRPGAGAQALPQCEAHEVPTSA